MFAYKFLRPCKLQQLTASLHSKLFLMLLFSSSA